MEYKATIGIEIHVELKTRSKMFSAAPNTYHEAPNSQAGLVDMSMPGTLPRLNMEAVRYGIQLATALNMQVDRTLYFDRKNYFYPDLPKGYQITQQDHPIGSHGYLDLTLDDGSNFRVYVQRAHLEEDTCKQTHLADVSLEDYNRCGVPLIEIVTEPCISTAQQAAKYVEGIREIVTYLGISDGRMDEGSMRCDTNVSIAPVGSDHLGTKCEVKNLNTIQNVEAAIACEIARQQAILEAGGTVEQETRRYDEKLKQTVLMRKKTNAVDYKYFREPNLPPFDLSERFIQGAVSSMRKLPWVYRAEFAKLGLSNYEVEQLMKDKRLVDYFERCLQADPKDVKTLWSYLVVDLQSYINKSLSQLTLDNLPFAPADLVALADLVATHAINSKQAKTVMEDLVSRGIKPAQSVAEHGFEQISDSGAIQAIVDEVVAAHPEAVEDWKHGKDRILGFLVGQVLKASHGKANPSMAREMVLAKIGPMGQRP